MASPTSSASSPSSSPGSPVYNPLQTIPPANANSVFAAPSTTEKTCSLGKRRWSGDDSSGLNPTPIKQARLSVCASPNTHSTSDTEEQPCCSATISHTAQRTASKVTKAKRKLSSSSSSDEETPRKRTCKRKHVGSPSPTSPKSPKKSPKHAPSSLLALLTQRPGGNQETRSTKRACTIGEWAATGNTSPYRKQRARLNALFVQRLQKEIQQALSSLDGDDRLIAKAFHHATITTPLSAATPLIFIKKQDGYKNRLDWHRLKLALARLETRSHSPLGEGAACQVLRWLKHFFRHVNSSPRLHTNILGKSLTHLCAQAIAGQDIELSENNSGYISKKLREETCLLSGEDLAVAQQNPECLYKESTVALLRHVGTPSYYKQDLQKQQPTSPYTCVDFEQQAATEAQTHQE